MRVEPLCLLTVLSLWSIGTSAAALPSHGRSAWHGSCIPMTSLRWWRVDGGEQVGHVLTYDEGTVERTGNTIVSVYPRPDRDGAVSGVTFWDVSTGQPTGHWLPPDSSTRFARFPRLSLSSDGSVLAVTCVESKKRVETAGLVVPGFFRRALRLEPVPDNLPDVLVLVDTSTHEEVGRYAGMRGMLTPDGKQLVSLNERGLITVWDPGEPRPHYFRLARAALMCTLACLIVAFILMRLVRLARRAWRAASDSGPAQGAESRERSSSR